MRTNNFSLIHLSDLHFGRIRHGVVPALQQYVQERKDQIRLVIITGDLTQRARRSQFQEAAEFIRSLPCPVFVIPGNHDVPLYNLFLRFFWPYRKFLKYLPGLTASTFEDEDLMVYGLWSLDRFTVKDARLKAEDVEKARAFFGEKQKFKVLAAHHPLHGLPEFSQVESLRVDLVVSGHDHVSSAREANGALLVSCGTTTSSRLRGEENAFNLITVAGSEIQVRHAVFNGESNTFMDGPTTTF